MVSQGNYEMFCYQCEMAKQGVGCTTAGICGKDPVASALQDLLIYALKGISMYAHKARQLGVVDDEVNEFTVAALFTTLTNVNFDSEALLGWLAKAEQIRNKVRTLYQNATKKSGKQEESLNGPAEFTAPSSLTQAWEMWSKVSILQEKAEFGETITGLRELIIYSIKGIAAYTYHARVLGHEDDAVYEFIHRALTRLAEGANNAEELLGLALESGKINLLAMELLDAANTTTYGHPEPTKVRITPVKGKAILVSGHDLKDLEELLKQTEGKGINVYTHGEMLPALAYPKLKKYKHLVGHYGTAWQNQRKEFDEFPGAILMTTNCLQKPRDSYKNRIFTSGVVGWEGVKHITNHDFKPVIEAALAAEGFQEDAPEKYITIGFARNTVLSVADQIINMVKDGDIRHFFLVGGCDGPESSRKYYTELAKQIPDDCLILTLGCGKFRLNHLELGDIGGIPRLLDMGQCNDAYSAIQVAVELAKAFNTDVNGLPLSLVLSWLEQKAVSILLTLLYLGVKNIRIGPTLPAFLTPEVVEILSDKFGLKPVSTPEQDLRDILGEGAVA